jgi:lysozyme
MKTMFVCFMLVSASLWASSVSTATILLRQAEGYRAQRYWDVSRYSIGYGSIAKPGEKSITRTEATARLVRTVVALDRQVGRLVKVQLSENQRAALVVFAYNTGLGGLSKSTLLRKINAGKFSEVPSEFRKWKISNGKVSKGLVQRREKEIELWKSKGG